MSGMTTGNFLLAGIHADLNNFPIFKEFANMVETLLNSNEGNEDI